MEVRRLVGKKTGRSVAGSVGRWRRSQVGWYSFYSLQSIFVRRHDHDSCAPTTR